MDAHKAVGKMEMRERGEVGAGVVGVLPNAPEGVSQSPPMEGQRGRPVLRHSVHPLSFLFIWDNLTI